METYKKVMLFASVFIFLFLIIPYARGDLGTFKQNDCVSIVVPLNVSSVTLTNINSPNATILVSNQIMTNLGNLFNYTFCGTQNLGRYTYGYCDNIGNCYGNSFTINGSGQDVSSSQISLIIIGLVIMIGVIIFFFVASLLFKHPGTKLFLMAISSVTMIVLIGVIASNAQIYLAEFPNLVSFYNNYYIVFIGLAGAALIGVLVWLIYYSFTLFSKSRGTAPDDD